jgi:hypothetical protein
LVVDGAEEEDELDFDGEEGDDDGVDEDDEESLEEGEDSAFAGVEGSAPVGFSALTLPARESLR